MNYPLPTMVCGHTALLTGNKKGNFWHCRILGERLSFFAATATEAKAKADAYLRGAK